MSNQAIANFLKAKREKKGMKAGEVAKLINMTVSNYCKIEKGQRPCQLVHLGRLANVLKFDFQELQKEIAKHETVRPT